MPELSTADHSVSPPLIEIPRCYNAAHDLIARNLQAGRADKPAFIDDNGSYTYADVARRSARFANALGKLGVLPEQRVLMCVHDTIDFPTVFLGAIRAGVVPIAVNTLLTQGDYEYMLTDSGARIAVVSGALLPLFAADSRSAMSASDADLVSRAWDLGALADAYSEFVTLYQPILDELRRDHMAGLSDQDAFLLRLLLIHDYRRLLLRDPELPEVLQPAEWPGQQARLLCKELYKRLEAPSNRHLDQEMCLADGSVPVVDRSLPERFPQYDPLKKT
jgi:hypothetical protein